MKRWEKSLASTKKSVGALHEGNHDPDSVYEMGYRDALQDLYDKLSKVKNGEVIDEAFAHWIAGQTITFTDEEVE
jgi:hypothetical protein